jgi:Icc-related predicted phosphoesterase
LTFGDPPGVLSLVCVSDLHGFLPDVPPCDVLVVAGDITPQGDRDPAGQARWLDAELRAWLDAAPARHVVAVAGNHDFVFQVAATTVPDLPWHLLQDSSCTLDGVRFWGSPWTPWFFDWAFNAPRGEEGEAFLAERYATCPAETDVVVLHGPPRGYGDRTRTGVDAGSSAALQLIDRVRPQLCVFGHIHEGHGAWRRGETQLANVTYVDVEYAPIGAPLARFEL